MPATPLSVRIAPPQSRRLDGVVRDYVELTKPRIVALLLITGLCAMVVAAGGMPSVSQTLWAMFGLALSCGGANAINMWYDRDIDPLMGRTRNRPVPSGRVAAQHALMFGIVLEMASFIALAMMVNLLSAVLAFAGFAYYVFLYTMWLKRRTPQNIVIGGGAGAFPPLVGWAAVTGAVGWPAILMFLIVFLWTPPHFWALALYKQDDYRRAGIPMMPVARGDSTTKRQSLFYAVLLVAVSLLLYSTHVVGLLYLAVAVVLGSVFIGHAVLLLRERAPEVKWAKRTFAFSLLYLTGIFAVMVLNVHR